MQNDFYVAIRNAIDNFVFKDAIHWSNSFYVSDDINFSLFQKGSPKFSRNCSH